MQLPNFITGQYLSARQVNTLTGAIAELHNRALTLRVPQQTWDLDSNTTRYFYVVHEHDATLAANEYLYMHIVKAAGATVDIYYKDMDTARDTITGAAGTYHRIVTIADKPTAGTHPVDEELVKIKVTSDSADNSVIWEISEIVMPVTGYVAMNDANALTTGEYADVATDLQHIADNVDALALVSTGPVKGMIQGEHSQMSRSEGETSHTYTVFSQYLVWNGGSKLYYHIGLGKDTSNAGWVIARIYIDDIYVPTGDTVFIYSGAQNTDDPDTTLEVFDGSVDISFLDANIGQRVKVEVKCETTVLHNPYDPVPERRVTGSAYCRVRYLGQGT